MAGGDGGRRDGEKIGRSLVSDNARNDTAHSGLPLDARSAFGGEARPCVIAPSTRRPAATAIEAVRKGAVHPRDIIAPSSFMT